VKINHSRVEKLTSEAIKKFQLNLKSMTVLTEAATGPFFITPVIAAKAGADVIAVAGSSKYGAVNDVVRYVKKQATYFSVSENIRIVTSLTSDLIHSADIVTNLGFVRPIDRNFISSMKSSAVITLMCEPWELRKKDVDLISCKERGILVMGTNEDAPELKVFDYVGLLCLKMLFDAELEVYQNNFLVISNDKFGKVITKCLVSEGANVLHIGLDLTSLEDIEFDRLDAIIVADYTFNETIVGSDGIISPKNIRMNFPEATIIQFAGSVDIDELRKDNIRFYPDYSVGSFKMGKTFGDLGMKPIIDLHTAGLKVGECLAKKARYQGENIDLRDKLIENSLCQGIETI
jgi:hypothetical protein